MDGGQAIMVNEEPVDKMNAAVGQDVTNEQFIKQEPAEMTVQQEPDESINEIPSINQRKRRHSSSSVSAISANETMDDGQEDVMIFKDLIRLPISKMSKPNYEEIKEESIEPLSESPAFENPASSIDQQNPDIAKIIEHEKVLKSLSELLGLNDVGGQPIRDIFTKYAFLVLHGSVFYEKTDTGDGYSVTVSTRHTGGTNTVRGIGNGHSMEDAKNNATKDALVKLFPNILFDASKSKRFLRVNNSMKRRLSEIGSESAGPSGNRCQDAIHLKAYFPSKKQQERYASSSASAISANETMDDGQKDAKEHIRVPKSKKNKPNDKAVKKESIQPSSESVILENPASSIDQQDPEIAKIIEHYKILKSMLKDTECDDWEGRSASEAFKLYKYRSNKQMVFYDITDVDGGFEAIATVSRLRRFCGRGNGSSDKLAKENAAKDALVREFPNILFDASDCILRIDESMKRRLDEKPRKAKRKQNRNRRVGKPKFTGATC